MDLVFASDRAQFLGGFVEYNSVPWDLGFRKAKEICFESRFMTAAECQADGFVSRVFPILAMWGLRCCPPPGGGITSRR